MRKETIIVFGLTIDNKPKFFRTEVDNLNHANSYDRTNEASDVALYVDEVTVIDPDTGGEVELTIFKDPISGGMFGVDASFLEQEEPETVIEPFNGKTLTILEEPVEALLRKFPGKFDAVEIQGVREEKDAYGEGYCEVVNKISEVSFYSVYLRYAEGSEDMGVECVSDHDTHAEAMIFAKALGKKLGIEVNDFAPQLN